MSLQFAWVVPHRCKTDIVIGTGAAICDFQRIERKIYERKEIIDRILFSIQHPDHKMRVV